MQFFRSEGTNRLTTIFVVINILVDIIYDWFDPRVRNLLLLTRSIKSVDHFALFIVLLPIFQAIDSVFSQRLSMFESG